VYSNLPCQTVHIGLYEMDIKMFSITFYNIHHCVIVSWYCAHCTDSRFPKKIIWPCHKVCETLLEQMLTIKHSMDVKVAVKAILLPPYYYTTLF